MLCVTFQDVSGEAITNSFFRSGLSPFLCRCVLKRLPTLSMNGEVVVEKRRIEKPCLLAQQQAPLPHSSIGMKQKRLDDAILFHSYFHCRTLQFLWGSIQHGMALRYGLVGNARPCPFWIKTNGSTRGSCSY